MPSLTEEQKIIMKHIIKSMNDADKIQEKMRRTDPNTYYRTASSGLMYNKPIGNCEMESLLRFYKMNDQRAQVRFSYENDHVFRGVLRNDYHVGIIYFDGDEWRFETYSNGEHSDEKLSILFSRGYNIQKCCIAESNLPKKIHKDLVKYIRKMRDDRQRLLHVCEEHEAYSHDETFQHFKNLKVGDKFEMEIKRPAQNGEVYIQKLKYKVTDEADLTRETFDNMMNTMKLQKEKTFAKRYSNN